MFDLLPINFISNLKLPAFKKGNYLSALVFGLVSDYNFALSYADFGFYFGLCLGY